MYSSRSPKYPVVDFDSLISVNDCYNSDFRITYINLGINNQVNTQSLSHFPYLKDYNSDSYDSSK